MFIKNNCAQHAYLFMYLANGFIKCIQVIIFPGIEPPTLALLVQNSTSWATGTKMDYVVSELYILDNSKHETETICFILQDRTYFVKQMRFNSAVGVCTQIQPPHTQVHIRNPFVYIWSPLMSAVAGLPLLWLQWAHSRALVIQQNVCGADLSRAVRQAWGWI